MQDEVKAIAPQAGTLGASSIKVAEFGANTTPGAGRGAKVLGLAGGFVAHAQRTSMGNGVMRNFILQQGFVDPAAEECPLQYSALTFQPKIVLIWVAAGILFQAQVVFAALCAILWWSALLPKLNPFSAVYNQTVGMRAGTFRLGSAPAPRRGAEMMAGTFALYIALLIHAGFIFPARVVEALLLAAALAVDLRGFCLGSFVYHLLRGNRKFALQTLPWAKNEMTYGVKRRETAAGSTAAPYVGSAEISRSGRSAPGRGTRLLVFAYGTAAHLGFVGVYLYLIAFLGNIGVPKSVDSTPTRPLWEALLIDCLLLGIFAVQHSVMARAGFKIWWTRIVPQPIERSTYVMISNVLVAALFWFWAPIGGTLWSIEDSTARAVLYAIFGLGWLQVLISSFFINHFDLFGTRQVWLYLKGEEYKPLQFKTPGAYKFVRHPLYVGWLMGFWATPKMTAAHLLFAVMTTAYILVAIQFEERDLVTVHGQAYAEYRKRVPMFIPRLFGKKPAGRKMFNGGLSRRVTATEAGE